MHKKKILLADLPETLKRVNNIGADIDGTLSSLPLRELQDMLKKVFYHSHAHELSHYDATLALYPELILHHIDQYMAALLKEVAS